MLFNSYEFIFAFLPVTLAGFFLLGTMSRGLALGWLTAASLGFYAWWRPINVLIVAPSIAINFFLARRLASTHATSERSRRATLIAGIVFNVVFLGYFKYTNFLVGAVNDVTGTELVWSQIILPLGISFITFQKIAFLVDVHAGRVTSFTFREYLLFVLFFPQLIAGPIVHFREIMPQFERARCRFNADDVAVGLTLLGIGLFKKVVLADGIAQYVSPIYQAAAAGTDIPFIAAWTAAVGFTLQIYFDFSGYSDMALGLARCFGVRLPANFDSPLKTSSIIDFWARWHITLTRFLAAYLYNPMVLWLTRRRIARGQSPIAGATTSPAAFLQVLVVPTLVTMGISGLWHGAGYTFVLWGLLHGLYLCVNHAWRLYGSKRISADSVPGSFVNLAGFVVTFLAVVAGMVLFRSPNLATADAVFRGMVGVGGLGLPNGVLARLGPLVERLPGLASGAGFVGVSDLAWSLAWLVGLLVIALALPNSLEIMSQYEPSLGVASAAGRTPPRTVLLRWRPSLVWAAMIAVLMAAAVMRLGPDSEFLYWQF